MTNEAPTGLPARALVSLLFLSVPVPVCIRWLWAGRGGPRVMWVLDLCWAEGMSPWWRLSSGLVHTEP